MQPKRKEYASGPVRKDDLSDDPQAREIHRKSLLKLRSLPPRKRYGSSAIDKSDPATKNVESVLQDLPPSVPAQTRDLLRNLVVG